ncbi:tail fiber domain-containing protein [Emticicia agri]|nr:tail fiber domain-containing protein [Emticicia agri]
MKKLHTFLLFLITHLVFAQSTTLTPGTVLPSMTTAQRTALASPTNGTLIFDTGTQSYWYRQSGNWVELPKSGSTTNYWQQTGLGGNEIKNTNSGGFWSANPTGLTVGSNNSSNPPTVPAEGAGTRLMWIPSRSAFRVGTVSVDNEDRGSAENIGLFTFAAGYDNLASSKYAIAIGLSTQATGTASIALGISSTASGYGATASGLGTVASGDFSLVAGYYNTASGERSTAMGSQVNTNNQKGTFIIGDSHPNADGVTLCGAPDQFVARFNNGYYLMTSGNQVRTGVQIAHGQSAWSAISDSTRKEKIVLADGESFLLKLRNLRLGSWNYKNQGTKPERFYGPMAQEIFTAFGKDKFGTIGNDTTVSTLNMDGLLFIFSQALEKRTQDLQAENTQLKNETSELRAIIQKLDARLAMLETYLPENSSTKQLLSQTDK